MINTFHSWRGRQGRYWEGINDNDHWGRSMSVSRETGYLLEPPPALSIPATATQGAPFPPFWCPCHSWSHHSKWTSYTCSATIWAFIVRGRSCVCSRTAWYKLHLQRKACAALGQLRGCDFESWHLKINWLLCNIEILSYLLFCFFSLPCKGSFGMEPSA